MRLLVPGILAGTALLLGVAILYEAVAPLDPVVIETPRIRPRPSRAVQLAAYAPPAIEAFADIDARPLFSAQRQPLNDPQATGAASAGSDFVLAGVIMSGDRAVALLRNKSNATTTSAVVGDLVNGWRVTKIDPTTVTLRANGGEFIVPLDGPANRPASAPLQPIATPAPATSTPSAPPPTVMSPAQTAAQFPLDPVVPPGASPRPPSATTTPAKPALPARPGGGTISPEALKGAPIDPTTGEPTL